MNEIKHQTEGDDRSSMYVAMEDGRMDRANQTLAAVKEAKRARKEQHYLLGGLIVVALACVSIIIIGRVILLGESERSKEPTPSAATTVPSNGRTMFPHNAAKVLSDARTR